MNTNKKRRTSFSKALRSLLLKPNERKDVESFTHILNDKTDFETVETFKSIRTNLMFSMPKTEEGKVIVVTSSTPGEGKTTTSINLAITFAQTGAKVVLIDCDLRKSRIHRYLNLHKTDGVSNVLCGFTTLENAVRRNVRENLDVIPAGEIPPNPTELIAAAEFEHMIDELKKQYDYVFIDTPPVTVVTDAAVAMRVCTGAVIVVRQDVTTYDLLDVTMSDIRLTGAKILGLITIGAREKGKGYGYYRHKGYHYKYNYSYADKESK